MMALKPFSGAEAFFSAPESGSTDEEILLAHNPKAPLDKGQI
jgi:hypothetical protein